MAPTPQEVVRRIGKEYVEDYPVVPPHSHETTHDVFTYEQTKHAFDVMADINDELFRDIPIPVVFTEDDPYESYIDMKFSVLGDNELRVFSGGDPHPIWDHHAEVTSRAVHDYHGHLHLDVPFTVEGEYRKWEHARNHYPAFCDRLLFTEVVGQLGAVHYLDDGFADDRFEQKVFPAPPEWIEDMARAIDD